MADVEENGHLSESEVLLSQFLRSVLGGGQGESTLLPSNKLVKLVVSSMRELVSLDQGDKTRLGDITAFLEQYIQAKVILYLQGSLIQYKP